MKELMEEDLETMMGGSRPLVVGLVLEYYKEYYMELNG